MGLRVEAACRTPMGLDIFLTGSKRPVQSDVKLGRRINLTGARSCFTISIYTQDSMRKFSDRFNLLHFV